MSLLCLHWNYKSVNIIVVGGKPQRSEACCKEAQSTTPILPFGYANCHYFI